jgi:hypothetical protein
MIYWCNWYVKDVTFNGFRKHRQYLQHRKSPKTKREFIRVKGMRERGCNFHPLGLSFEKIGVEIASGWLGAMP